MQNFVFCLAFFILSLSALAQRGEPLKIKDRLRVVLWTEGLDKELTFQKRPVRSDRPLPEELERPLQKFGI